MLKGIIIVAAVFAVWVFVYALCCVAKEEDDK